MIKIAAVEDEKIILNSIISLTKQFFYKKEIHCKIDGYHNSELLLYEISENHNYDIYLLDIEMPGLNGIDLAKILRNQSSNIYIVFITSHMNFLIDGYDVHAFQFIPKEEIRYKLPRTLEKIYQELDFNTEKYYIIHNTCRYEKIYLNDIYCIYKEKKNAVFITKNGVTEYRETLKNIFDELDAEEFMFIDRGYIVNIIHIMKIKGNVLYLRNNNTIFVSRNHLETIKERVFQYWKDHII